LHTCRRPREVEYLPAKDLLTVQASEAELKPLLAKISLKARKQVFLDPQIEGRVSASIKARPLADALASLLRQYNHVFVYQERKGNADTTARVSAVHIQPRGQLSCQHVKPPVALAPQELKKKSKAHKERREKEHEKERGQRSAKKQSPEERQARLQVRLQRLEQLKTTNPDQYPNGMEG